MTKRLYLTDSYYRNIETTVVSVNSKGVVLDQTVFYPESGGQLGDRGKLKMKDKTVNVTNTKQQKGELIHELDSIDGLEEGMTVYVELDWDRRYQQMRAHSAQHVISRFFQLNYEAETVSNQLKTTSCRLDLFPLSKISVEELSDIFIQINDIISRNMSVSISFLPRDEAIEFLKEKEYQIKYLNMVPKSVKEFRIVSINDYDFAACAGTHIKNTSEIGKILIEKTVNKGKKRERVYYSVNPKL
ncbi:MAG: alanyl-tRNA editing protein [Candidatus Hodarchaeota archaeon]